MAYTVKKLSTLAGVSTRQASEHPIIATAIGT
jgi:hypothetical protein